MSYHDYRHPEDVSRAVNTRLYLTRREVRDIWYAVAKIRDRNGDAKGAARARQTARTVSGDYRKRHDI